MPQQITLEVSERQEPADGYDRLRPTSSDMLDDDFECDAPPAEDLMLLARGWHQPTGALTEVGRK